MKNNMSGAIAGDQGTKVGATGAKSANRKYNRADSDKAKSNVGRGSMNVKSKTARG